MIDGRAKDALREWVKRIDAAKIPIVVEGPKDRQALETLGAKDVFILSRKPLFAVAEEIASNFDEVIILTDFDKKGRELYGRLAKIFSRLGVKVDRSFRETLQKHARISHVEGLVTALRTRGVI